MDVTNMERAEMLLWRAWLGHMIQESLDQLHFHAFLTYSQRATRITPRVS